MKKTLLTLVIVLSTILTYSQSYYKAYATEMYVYDNKSKEWELYQKNSDTDIIIVVEDEFITFQAKSPSMYKIYADGKTEINNKSLKGYRYNGRELKTDDKMVIDIVRDLKNDVGMISIINYDKGYNLRFYIVPAETK